MATGTPKAVTIVTANDGAQSGQEFNAMLETRQQIETALRASFIFPLLAPAEQDRFIAAAIPQSWWAEEPIFFMGDAGASMMLVQAGEIRISRPSASGRMVILNELKPGAVFGEIALLDGGERSADATATTNCKLLVFERRSFVALLDNNWPLAEALLKLVCSRLRRADERVADLVFSDLPGRLAKELLARAARAKRGADAGQRYSEYPCRPGRRQSRDSQPLPSKLGEVRPDRHGQRPHQPSRPFRSGAADWLELNAAACWASIDAPTTGRDR
jgi:CRP/FNR family transcriptional regulator, cyclic AMP receptor protein